MSDFEDCAQEVVADLLRLNDIYLQALKLACKTLNAVCMTQNYTLGLGQNEKYFIKKANFIKKAKETLKND